MHAMDRLQERAPGLHPDTVEHLQAQADGLEVPPGHYYLPLTDDSGSPMGYAAFKTVDSYPRHKLVLATILGPQMTPKGSSLSHVMQQPRFQKAAYDAFASYGLKLADMTVMPEGYSPEAYQQLQDRFKHFQDLVRHQGVLAGTAHNRIVIPKSTLTENDLTKGLGFVPVTIAIPEAGQDRFQSFRHPDHNFHVHSHGNMWTMHEDAHPAATMLVKKVKKTGDKVKAFAQGLPHVNEEGIPGLYYYLKGRLNGHASTAQRVLSELPDQVKSHIFSLAPSPTYTPDREDQLLGKAAALFEFGLAKLAKDDHEKPTTKEKALPPTVKPKKRPPPEHRLNLPVDRPDYKLHPLTERLLAKSPVRVTMDPGAHMEDPEYQGWYDLKNKDITVTHPSPNVLAHEIGHAKFDKSRLGDIVQSRFLYPRIYDAPLAAVLGGATAGSFGAPVLSRGTGAAAILPLLLSAPALVSEGVASYKGHRTLKDVGATPAELAQYRREMLRNYGSYATLPAGSLLAGAAAYGLGRFG